MLYLAPYIGSGKRDDKFRPMLSDDFTPWGAFDRRPDPTVVDGYCIVHLPETGEIDGLFMMGDHPDAEASERCKVEVSDRLKLLPDARLTVSQVISRIAFEHDAPGGGLFCNRLGVKEVYIGGQRWARTQVTPPVLGELIDPTDNFTRADETPVAGNWTTITGLTGLRLLSNLLAGPATDTDGGIYWNANTPANDQFCEFTISVVGTSCDWGVGCRVSTSDFSMYMANAFNAGGGGANDREITKIVAGSFTSLATVTAVALAASTVLRVEAEGTTVRYKVDGVQPSGSPTTDGSIGSGRWGMFSFQDDPRWSFWTGGDIGGGAVAARTLGLLGVGKG